MPGTLKVFDLTFIELPRSEQLFQNASIFTDTTLFDSTGTLGVELYAQQALAAQLM
jgi:hypothetical protein